MDKYPSIQTVFERDPATNHKTVLWGQWARPEFMLLRDIHWDWTEKIDGTNIRVEWDPVTGVAFGGRTERAHIPAPLIARLMDLFPSDSFLTEFPDLPMTLYGEGFGAGIQKGGGDYMPDGHGVDFIVFDVLINGHWQSRADVADIAHKLGVRVVPRVGVGSIGEALEYARTPFPSIVDGAHRNAEGLVLRPAIELCDRLGYRIITKIKTRDFWKGTDE